MLAPWTIDGIAGTFPVDAVLHVIPTTTTTATGPHTTWRLRVLSLAGAVLYNGPKPASLVIRGAAGNSRLQLWSKPSHYDQFRGILRLQKDRPAQPHRPSGGMREWRRGEASQNVAARHAVILSHRALLDRW